MRTRSATGRPRRLTRAGAVAVLTWVLAVVVGSAIAWRALAVVDSGERTGVLSEAQVTAALADAQAPAAPSPSATPTALPSPTATTTAPAPPTSTPTPTSSSTPAPKPTRTTAPPPPAPAPTTAEVARTWTVAGGIVAVSCRGGSITLLYATPSDGWTVEVGSSGPERVEVELHRDKAETKLRGTCVNGVPDSHVDSEDDSSEDRSDDGRSSRVDSSTTDG